MTDFQPPPTYALPVEVDPVTQKATFSRIWLNWFYALVKALNTAGTTGGAIQHNSLSGLQGGTSNEFYHLKQTEYTNLKVRSTTAPSAITVTASPFTYQNATGFDADIIVSGGTVSDISFSRDNSTYYTLGVVAGEFRLSPSDYLKVTYTVAPTMTLVPR